MGLNQDPPHLMAEKKTKRAAAKRGVKKSPAKKTTARKATKKAPARKTAAKRGARKAKK